MVEDALKWDVGLTDDLLHPGVPLLIGEAWYSYNKLIKQCPSQAGIQKQAIGGKESKGDLAP
jgi:hypothetical protein